MKSGFNMVVIACTLLSACDKPAPNALSAEEDARLFKLAQMNDCIECHTVNASSIGPSWMAVADRYKAAPRAEARVLLIDSAMNGSKGKWITWRGSGGCLPWVNVSSKRT